MDVLVVLVPEIVKRSADMPLQVKITNLWSLVRLRIIHDELIALVVTDLQDPAQRTSMPAKDLCRLIWVMSRCNAFSMIREMVLPMVGSAMIFRVLCTVVCAAELPMMTPV